MIQLLVKTIFSLLFTNKVQAPSVISYKNTFTDTTGHQLCVFGGPMFFIYKIITTINLTQKLKKSFPDYNFVPLFWMASEDHDLDEVKNVKFFGDKFQWNTDSKGKVGDIQTGKISELIKSLKIRIGDNENSDGLFTILSQCYNGNKLSESTRLFVNHFFGKYGVVILDPDDEKLKREMLPLLKEDVCENNLSEIINKTSFNLSRDYKIQAKVKNINFFKLTKDDRIP